MKKQFLFINGGVPKENFDSYYDSLKSLDYNPYEEKFENWNKTLEKYLGDDWKYFRIPFVDKNYADYEAWKICFSKILPFLKDDVIIGATSLGGTFIIKYLIENKFPVKIKKLILIAAAINDSKQEKLGSFSLDKKNIFQIKDQIGEIICYHSRDDKLVPYSDFLELKTYFPKAIFREFFDKGHFYSQERLVEIEDDIKN